MTSIYPHGAGVVNLHEFAKVDSAESSADRVIVVSTLAERVAWILESTTDPQRKPWSRRSLSLAAGLSQSHVGQILRGTVAGPQVGSETIERLAEAGQVDPAWLMTGRGHPRPPAADPMPRRALAAELAREAGVPDAAIAAVLVETPTADQLGWPTLRWANYMQQRALELLNLANRVERPAPDESGATPVRALRAHVRHR